MVLAGVDELLEESKEQKVGGGGFILTMKIKLKGKMLGLEIEVEEEYP